MDPTEILMLYQGLVEGAGPFAQSPSSWPFIANALVDLQACISEYLECQDALPSLKFIDVARKYYGNRISLDIPITPKLGKRQSMLSMYHKVVGKPTLVPPSGLGRSCFYFQHGSRALFILRTKQEPQQFFRIDLADETGALITKRSNRPLFSEAFEKHYDSFSRSHASGILSLEE